MKLFYAPGACSIGIHVLMEEVGKPYEGVPVSLRDGAQFKPEFTSVNPKSKVPTVVDDEGTVRTEFPAIAYWLARTNPFATDDGPDRLEATMAALGLDAMVAIGGDDTLGAADRLYQRGLPVVGVPKTIDNDLSGTEVTFGFDTAVQIATDAIDRLQTTAESHHRVIVCEVMGRNVGWIAVHAGMAGGAAEILIPEVPFSVDAVCDRLQHRHNGDRYFSTVVVAEGALPRDDEATWLQRSQQSGRADQFGHIRLGGIGDYLAEEIEQRTGFEARSTVLGHIQRGGSPTAFDRVLATRFGAAALAAVHDRAFGTMVALQGGSIIRIPLSDAIGKPKRVDPQLYEVAGLYLG